MTTFIKTKFNKSDDQTNIGKNITEYQNNLPKLMEKRQLFHVKKMYVKMDVWTFCSQLSSYCDFYIVPNCIRNHHTKFEIDRTILTYLK